MERKETHASKYGTEANIFLQLALTTNINIIVFHNLHNVSLHMFTLFIFFTVYIYSYTLAILILQLQHNYKMSFNNIFN